MGLPTKDFGIKVRYPLSVFCWHFKMNYWINLSSPEVHAFSKPFISIFLFQAF
jgi:hypothetical protein